MDLFLVLHPSIFDAPIAGTIAGHDDPDGDGLDSEAARVIT